MIDDHLAYYFASVATDTGVHVWWGKICASKDVQDGLRGGVLLPTLLRAAGHTYLALVVWTCTYSSRRKLMYDKVSSSKANWRLIVWALKVAQLTLQMHMQKEPTIWLAFLHHSFFSLFCAINARQKTSSRAKAFHLFLYRQTHLRAFDGICSSCHRHSLDLREEIYYV